MTGIQREPKPYCPDCGAQMELKEPPRGQTWKPFWGCSEYKYGCRGKRQIAPDGTPESDKFVPGDFD